MLLFEEATPGAAPLMISIDERGALPLFDSAAKAQAFLGSTNFGPGWKPVEVSGAGLLAVLETCRDEVEFVMKVEMGSLKELIDALEQSQREDDLFGLDDLSQN